MIQFKQISIFLASLLALLVVLTSENSGCSQGSGGNTNLPQCDTLQVDSIGFFFTTLKLKYDFTTLDISDAERMELSGAHMDFYQRQGEFTSLPKILYPLALYNYNYNRPMISAEFFWEGTCNGSISKEFTVNEVSQTGLLNAPFLNAMYSRVIFTVKTIRTNFGNKQIIWTGDIRHLENYTGTFTTNGQLNPLVIEVDGITNTTPGHRAFAGYALEGNTGPIQVFENTIDSTFMDNITTIIVSNQPFYFSYTLSQPVYINGIFDETIHWRIPDIFVFEEGEEGEEEELGNEG